MQPVEVIRYIASVTFKQTTVNSIVILFPVVVLLLSDLFVKSSSVRNWLDFPFLCLNFNMIGMSYCANDRHL